MRGIEYTYVEMKKYFYKILTSGLILTVFLTAVLCCHCLKTAEAGYFPGLMNVAKPMPACHAHPGKTGGPAQADHCCNPQLQADHPAKIFLKIPQTVNDFVLLSILFPQQFVFQDRFNLACLNGPPGPISDPPLYILSHNFRI